MNCMNGYAIIVSLVGAFALMSGHLLLVANSDRLDQSSAIDFDILDPEALVAIQAEDEAATREEILEKLVSVLRTVQRNENAGGNPSGIRAGNGIDYGYGPLGLSKRQIRYHQCYFNPISCFRRRK